MLKLFVNQYNFQINTLLPVSLCFGVTLLLAHYGISMEVGCFLCGVIIKSLNRGEQTQRLVEPGKHFIYA